VEIPPPATGAAASLVGVVSVVTYGESTAEGFVTGLVSVITYGELTAEGFVTGVVLVVVATSDELTAEGFLTGVISVVVTYIDSTAEGFFIDTVNSPFDVFTVFKFKTSPKKSTLRVLSTSYEFWSHSIVVCGFI
jgi:hypothetical protein